MEKSRSGYVMYPLQAALRNSYISLRVRLVEGINMSTTEGCGIRKAIGEESECLKTFWVLPRSD
jgi:hypothetical protein